MSARIEDVGATELEGGVLTVQIGDNDDPEWPDADDEVPVVSALGLCARPYPADADGAPQALVMDTESSEFIAGIRDTRCVAQNTDLAEGDTRLHCVGPNSASCMVTLRETKTIQIVADLVTVSGNFSTAGDALIEGTTTIDGALNVGSAAGEVAFEAYVTAAMNTLKSAISTAPITAADGGATFKAALVTALAAWPPNLKCSNIKGDG